MASPPSSLVLMIALAGVALVGVVIALLVLRSNLHFCKPNEVLVLCGRRYRAPDGSQVGYRIVTEGGGFTVPLIERAERLDARVIHLRLGVDAYAKGNVRVGVQVVGQVRISRDPTLVRNAVERFLGASRDDLRSVARETLQGHLRGLMSGFEPTEIHRDRARVGRALEEASRSDLASLGLRLEGLVVDLVMDDEGQLDRIGRETRSARGGRGGPP